MSQTLFCQVLDRTRQRTENPVMVTNGEGPGVGYRCQSGRPHPPSWQDREEDPLNNCYVVSELQFYKLETRKVCMKLACIAMFHEEGENIANPKFKCSNKLKRFSFLFFNSILFISLHNLTSRKLFTRFFRTVFQINWRIYSTSSQQ